MKKLIGSAPTLAQLEALIQKYFCSPYIIDPNTSLIMRVNGDPSYLNDSFVVVYLKGRFRFERR